jgi:hypothetical protein
MYEGRSLKISLLNFCYSKMFTVQSKEISAKINYKNSVAWRYTRKSFILFRIRTHCIIELYIKVDERRSEHTNYTITD